MSAPNHCCVFQLLGTLRFVRRWVVIGRVLQRAWRELWALTVLLLLLLLLCTHIGNTVQEEQFKYIEYWWRKNVFDVFLCLCFSSSPVQWRASCQYIRPVCQCYPSCVVGWSSKDYAGCTQSWALFMGYYWWGEVSGSWLDSVELFSSVHTGTHYLFYSSVDRWL